jgi:CRP/FNR family transcriptional regulator, cyclic AMP receptor protein
MTHGGEIGFVASALVLVAFGMKNMINLRIVAICSNFAFIAYALVLNLPPVLVLHVILLPLNGWRLAQAFQDRHRTHEISERSWDSVFGKTATIPGVDRPT